MNELINQQHLSPTAQKQEQSSFPGEHLYNYHFQFLLSCAAPGLGAGGSLNIERCWRNWGEKRIKLGIAEIFRNQLAIGASHVSALPFLKEITDLRGCCCDKQFIPVLNTFLLSFFSQCIIRILLTCPPACSPPDSACFAQALLLCPSPITGSGQSCHCCSSLSNALNSPGEIDI